MMDASSALRTERIGENLPAVRSALERLERSLDQDEALRRYTHRHAEGAS